MYAVFCRYQNGTIRRGNPIEKHIAEAWADAMNREFSDILHWIEKVT